MEYYAALDSVVRFSWFAIDVKEFATSFKPFNVRTGLPYIQTAAEHQEEIGSHQREICPAIAIRADHPHAQWMIEGQQIGSHQRMNHWNAQEIHRLPKKINCARRSHAAACQDHGPLCARKRSE